MNENTDNVTELPLTAQDQADLEHLLQEEADTPYHSVLEVWSKVLEPIESQKAARITPQWALRIASNYQDVTLQDIPAFRDSYFDKLLVLRNILDAEVATNKNALKVANPDEDLAENRGHYLNLLLLWQSQILQWELEWRPEDSDSAIQLAAMGEAHKMFLGEQGLLPFLESINFDPTEDEQQLIQAGLTELIEEAS